MSLRKMTFLGMANFVNVPTLLEAARDFSDFLNYGFSHRSGCVTCNVLETFLVRL